MKYQAGLWTVIIAVGCIAQLSAAEQVADEKPDKAVPAQPRKITTIEYLSYPPTFATEAGTLDPVEVVRYAWKGYLTHIGDPWGMMPGLQPMLRLYQSNHALPWPQLIHHTVDGPDNNARNIGSHAMLHAMLGAEKDNDPAEAGQIAYLLSLTPRGAESFIAHGELAKNILLLYEQTGTEWHRDWAQKIMSKLLHPSVSRGGWNVGWNLCALSQWYELTGQKDSLALAVACADRLCISRDEDIDDGCFRSDGSFGDKSLRDHGSFHMHGNTHCLPGLLCLGEQLLKDGQKDKGLQMILQAKNTFNWLYDPSGNPDAGSMTGWLGEWLRMAYGGTHNPDCEGCTMGDMVQTPAMLTAASVRRAAWSLVYLRCANTCRRLNVRAWWLVIVSSVRK